MRDEFQNDLFIVFEFFWIVFAFWWFAWIIETNFKTWNMSIDFIDLYLIKLNFLFSIYFSIHTSNITIQLDENFQLLQRCRMFRFCLFIYSYCQHHTSIFSSNFEMNVTTNSTNTRCRHSEFVEILSVRSLINYLEVNDRIYIIVIT